MQLSDRLMKIVSMVSGGMITADVGTDHGYVPIALAGNNKTNRIIAMDINKGPLERARQNIEEAGLSEYIELRLSDGLEKLMPGEAECIVIAGMGGLLMKRILSDGLNAMLAAGELVLSPQSDIDEVRSFVLQNGFDICDEAMLIDEGKFYTIIKAVKGSGDTYSDTELKFGKCLLTSKNEVLFTYLNKEKLTLEKILRGLEGNESEAAVKRCQEIICELRHIDDALSYY